MNLVEWEARNAEENGRDIALICGALSISNQDLFSSAKEYAMTMRDLGLVPGDRVALALPLSIEIYSIASAVWIAGGVVVLVDCEHSDDRQSALENCRPRLLIENGLQPGDGKSRIDANTAGTIGDFAVIKQTDLCRSSEASKCVQRDKSDIAQIAYTSGSSGRPKGVVFTHGGLSAFCQFQKRQSSKARARRRVLLAFPPTAFGGRLISGRAAGNAQYVLLGRFRDRDVLHAIQQHAITDLPLLPAHAERLLASAYLQDYDLSSVARITMGGAQVSRSLVDRLRAVFRANAGRQVDISIVYGSTEAGGACAIGFDGGDDKIGAIVPGATIRILDTSGSETATGVPGQIVVRTPFCGVRYWENVVETESVFRDGYVHTGDMGFLDANNELHVLGRIDEMMIQGGQNVFPDEIARVLHQIEGVLDCAVVAVPDEFLGQAIVACIVDCDNGGPSEKEIRAQCRSALGPRKVPVHVLRLDEIPRGAFGKVRAAELKSIVIRSIERRERSMRQSNASARNRIDTRDRVAGVLAASLEHLIAMPSESVLTELDTCDRSFSDIGVDSVGIVKCAHDLGELLGVTVSPATFFAHPSPRALIDHLVECARGDTNSQRAPIPGAHHQRSDVHLAPIAIVGIGCRLPGSICGPSALWDALIGGRDLVSAPPQWRSMHRHWQAGFVQDFDGFDADFFALRSEAAELDPRQRVLLEVVWESLEDFGCDALGLQKDQVGVYLGLSGERYGLSGSLGASPGMAIGRICHFYGWRGPALIVDTTCSSSATAIHLAVQGLRRGECSVAIAGGANLIQPNGRVAIPGFTASDGRCRPFDARADGFGQGEGCVLLVLKRTEDALRDGDRGYAQILGSAINHDGRAMSLTAPNAESQSAVIRAALADAQRVPDDIQYIEAHGTGTLLGDPVEIRGILGAIGNQRRHPLHIGSVKSNLGHLEAAAGVAGVAKAALCIRHAKLVRSIHFEEPNPHIPWSEIPIEVQRTTDRWPLEDKPLICGVSSFGMSGTNAHIVLGPFRDPAGVAAVSEVGGAGASSGGRYRLLPVSAASLPALRAQLSRWSTFLNQSDALDLHDVGFNATHRRAQLHWRTAVVGSTSKEWGTELAKKLQSSSISVQRETGKTRRIAFVFGGQGTQFEGMAGGLRSEPVFMRTIERCIDASRPFLAQSDYSPLFDTRASFNGVQAESAQPILCAFQIALFDFISDSGISADFVIGHSLGEIAAAYAAGALSLEAAIKLSCQRGRVMASAKGSGAMLLVQGERETLDQYIQSSGYPIEIAAFNSPSRISIAGDIDAIERALDELPRLGMEAVRLGVNAAFHSRQFDAASETLLRELQDAYSPGASTKMISTVTAELGPVLSPQYWAAQMRRTVRFSEAISRAIAEGVSVFIDLSPRSALLSSLREIITERGLSGLAAGLASGRKPVSPQSILTTIGDLYAAGVSVDWDRHYPSGTFVSLPTYAWKHESFWLRSDRQLSATPSSPEPRTPVSHRPEPPDFAKSIFRVEWVDAPLGERVADIADSWAIVGPSEPAICAIRSALEELGGVVLETVVYSPPLGSRCEAEAGVPDSISLDDRVPQWPAFESASGLIFIADPEGPESDTLDGRAIDDFAMHGVVQLASLLRHLIRTHARVPKLVVATSSLMSPESGQLGLMHAPLWGYCLSIARELSNVELKLVGNGGKDGTYRRLAKEIASWDDETRIEYRSGRRFAARLASSIASGDRNNDSLPAGTYLVSGASGALGRSVCRYLVANGATGLVLVARRSLSDSSEVFVREIRDLRERGVAVEYLAADVADLNALNSALSGLPREVYPIVGVFHCAGVIDDGTAVNLDASRIRSVMAPKVSGAWNLHRLCIDARVFVMFSSIAGCLGSAGQANYSSANYFMDALASYRRNAGLPAHSLAWGGWNAGMAVRDGAVNDGLLDSEHALLLMGEVLRGTDGLALIVNSSEVIAAAATARFDRRFFGLIGEDERAFIAGVRSASQDESGEQADFDARGSLVRQVQECIAKCASVDVDAVRMDVPLTDYGMDSLSVLRLRALLADSGIAVDPRVLSAEATANQLMMSAFQEQGVQLAATFESPVRKLKSSGKEPGVVFLHPVGGGLGCYQALVEAIGRAAYGMESPFLGRSGVRFGSISELAEFYLRSLDQAGLDSIECLIGWSMGGLIALEMARSLTRCGGPAPLVVMIDTPISGCMSHRCTTDTALPTVGEKQRLAGRSQREVPEVLTSKLGDFGRFLTDLSPSAGGEHWSEAVDSIRETAIRTLNSRDDIDIDSFIVGCARQRAIAGEYSEKDLVRLFVAFQVNKALMDMYSLSPYQGRVLAITASKGRETGCETTAAIGANVRVVNVAGDHYSIMREPQVFEVASIISESIKDTHILDGRDRRLSSPACSPRISGGG